MSLGSIPIFIGFLSNFDAFSEFLYYYYDLSQYEFSFVVYFFTSLLVLLFFIKNLFLLFIIFFENYLVAKLKIDISQRLFSSYINRPYSFFINKNPSEITRNLVDEITKCCQAILLFLVFMREFVVLLGIGVLAISLKPLLSFSVTFYILISALIYVAIFRGRLTVRAKK